MHGDECIIELMIQLSVLSPVTKYCFKKRKLRIRKSELETEYDGKESADHCPRYPGDQELLTNSLMILAENIFGNETLFVVVMPVSMSIGMDHIVRPLRSLMHMYCLFVVHMNII